MSTALAATNLAPALVLAPTALVRPLAPGVLVLADEPGDGLGRAAALAGLGLVGNFFAVAVAVGLERTRLARPLDRPLY